MLKKLSFSLIIVLLAAGLIAGAAFAETNTDSKSGFELGNRPRLRIGKVTGIGASDFTIEGLNGETLQITVTEETVFRTRQGEEPADAAFEDLVVGQYVGVAMQNGSENNPKARLVVFLPEDFDPAEFKPIRAAGKVTLLSEAGGFFEMETRKGETLQISVDENTRYTGSADSLADLAEGTLVGVLAVEQEDGTLLAKAVAAKQPRLPLAETHGTITALTSDSLTIEDRNGQAHTFTVTENTIYKDRTGEVNGLNDLETGMIVIVAHLRETEVNEAKAVLVADKALLRLERVQGVIKSVNQNNLTLEVNGEVMHLTIDDHTRVKGVNISSIDDLEKDMRVLVLYQEDENGKLTAKAITGVKRP